jgi:hypothetical protein
MVRRALQLLCDSARGPNGKTGTGKFEQAAKGGNLP